MAPVPYLATILSNSTVLSTVVAVIQASHGSIFVIIVLSISIGCYEEVPSRVCCATKEVIGRSDGDDIFGIVLLLNDDDIMAIAAVRALL